MSQFTGSPDWQLRKRLTLRLKGLRSERAPFERHYADLARYHQPRLGRYLRFGGQGGASGQVSAEQLAKGDQINGVLLNEQGIYASEVFANGMASGMSSPARPWMMLTTQDPGMREYRPAKEWLEETRRRIFIYLAKTGWYPASKEGYLETGIFGTEACFMSEHWDYLGVTNQMTAGEYYIALNDAMKPDTMYRRCDFTTIQLVNRFGLEKCAKAVRDDYNKGEYSKSWECWHAVEPNISREPGKMGWRGKRWLSVYWMTQVQEGADRDPPILGVSGYSDQPFYASRGDVTGSDAYGRSRGMISLPTMKSLQIQELRKAQATELVNAPPVYGPQSLNQTRVNLMPRGITAVSGLGNSEIKAVYTVPWQIVERMETGIQRSEAKVDRAFSVQLFQAISQMEGIQPRNILELTRRNEEQLQQLGPMVDRMQSEKLEMAVNRAFYILLRAGLIPPPPPEMQGQELEIQFISVMAEAQRAVGLTSIERTFAFAGSLIAAFPQVGDKLDVDQAMDEYAAMSGSPAKIIRSDEDVQAIRDGRQQQEQQERMAQMAPAMADGAQAAKLLSETTNDEGQSLLQGVMGNV